MSVEYLAFEYGPVFRSIDDSRCVEVFVSNGYMSFICTRGFEVINGGGLEYKGNTEEWLNKLEELKLHRWKKEYNDIDTLDGDYWEIDYRKQGWKRTRHFIGMNDYPENWEKFRALIRELEIQWEKQFPSTSAKR